MNSKSEREGPRSVESEANTYRGVLEAFTDQGMEGLIVWMFQDEKFITPKSDAGGQQWSFEGSYFLQDGDKLTIYNPDEPSQIEWEGEVSLHTEPIDYDPQHPEEFFSLKAYGSQDGLKVKDWANYFVNHFPAKLTTKSEPVGKR